MHKEYSDITQINGLKCRFDGYSGVDKSILESSGFGRIMGLVNYKSEIVLILHEKGSWNFPGGHMEAGENAMETLLRELDEEADVKAKPEAVEPVLLVKTFTMPDDEWIEDETQLICYAEIDELPPLTPDPDEDIIDRKLVSVDEIYEYIMWDSITWITGWLQERIYPEAR